MKTCAFLIAVSTLFTACSHQAKPTAAPDSMSGDALHLQFEEGEVDIYVRSTMKAEWKKSHWNNETIAIPRRASKNVSYTKLNETQGLLKYASPARKDGYSYNYELTLDFNTPQSGYATGTGSDFEWLIRYKKVPFTLED